VTWRVELIPSGRMFEAEEGETLLEAALRSGINLTYNCANGTCGGCKIRIEQGDVESSFHDFALTEAEKIQRKVLVCRAHARSDLVVEAIEVNDVNAIPMQEIPTRVARLERLSQRHLVLHLRTPRTRTLRFLAGQYVVLSAAGLPDKPLPVASCPCNGHQLQFHLRNKSYDPFCHHAFNNMRVGDEIALRGPFGNFTLDDRSERPLLLIAVETAFAYAKSLIEHAIAIDYPQPIDLYWVSRRVGGHYLGNYGRAWQDAVENFHYHPVTRQESGDPEQLAAAIVAEINQPQASELYLAGEGRLIESLQQQFVQVGVSMARIHRSHPLDQPASGGTG
jgi:CDP-4-dehydro-6-deoxyglucose reductase